MTKSRRDFLWGIGKITAGAPFLGALIPGAKAASGERPPRWGMILDLRKCIGCHACTVSCIMENAVPENNFRTFVSTYEVTDTVDVGTVEKESKSLIALMPRLCNHCTDPACVPVCPVGATYAQKDGIVVVDGDRCVGCGYCVQACPYDARFINKETNSADKCTFCAHRVDVGLLPACVETCVGGARIFGDFNDPDSTVSQLMEAHKNELKVLKPEAKTQPNVFYLGLDERFTSRVEGEMTLWHPTEA